MNAKQLGIVIVLVAILLLVQLAQSFRNKASALDKEVAEAAKEEKSLLHAAAGRAGGLLRAQKAVG